MLIILQTEEEWYDAIEPILKLCGDMQFDDQNLFIEFIRNLNIDDFIITPPYTPVYEENNGRGRWSTHAVMRLKPELIEHFDKFIRSTDGYLVNNLYARMFAPEGSILAVPADYGDKAWEIPVVIVVEDFLKGVTGDLTTQELIDEAETTIYQMMGKVKGMYQEEIERLNLVIGRWYAEVNCDSQKRLDEAGVAKGNAAYVFKPSCPQCKSRNLIFTDMTLTEDHEFVDVIVACQDCRAELNACYTLVEITEDPY